MDSFFSDFRALTVLALQVYTIMVYRRDWVHKGVFFFIKALYGPKSQDIVVQMHADLLFYYPVRSRKDLGWAVFLVSLVLYAP